MQPTTGY